MSRKVVVITGCDSGLGFSLALRCAVEDHVVVAGCLNPNGKGAQQLKESGVTICEMDVTDGAQVAQVAELVAGILKNNSRYELQAVVNNAGVMVVGEFEWQTAQLIEHQVQVNLLGSFKVAKNFLKLLQKSKGRLINITSHCASAGLPFMSVYGGTKAALSNWNDALRIEQEKYGVKVISFTPGSFFADSRIMARQNEYYREMEKGVEEEGKHHLEYMSIVENYISQLPIPQEPKVLTDKTLLDKLMSALFDRNPRTSYKHEPFRYTFYHWLFKFTPVWLRDLLVRRFVSFPNHPHLE